MNINQDEIELFVDSLDIDTIEHSGIKGQKWGIRNYQNADGTLTEAGKERYRKITDKSGSTTYSTRYHGIPDDVLRQRIQRVQLERQLSDLSGETKYEDSSVEKQRKARETFQTITGGIAVLTALLGLYGTWKAKGKNGGNN